MTSPLPAEKADVSSEVRASLIWWSAQAYPDEACGVIVNGEAFLLRNVHPEPEAFFHMDDEELMAVYQRGAPEAVWHSHPNGDPSPSTADIDGTPPGMTMMIVAAGEIYEYQS